ncbi:MAG: LptF/LptG family permease [Rhodospirillaceae bacterium]|nr:LptF/LptG family permease [Rhodospirillaceae bacterium]
MFGLIRYIARQLVVGTAMVSIVLVFIVWLTQSLRFLQFVMNKGLPLGTWLKLTVYMLPGFFTLILPIAFFFVVLFVYNKLAMDKELVVVQAAGVSRAGLALPAVLTGLALTGLGLAMTSSVVPAGARAFKDLQWTIRTDVSQVMLREGAFNGLGDGLTVYVRGRDGNGELIGLMVDDKRAAGKAVTLLAERGAVSDGERGPVVTLKNGSRQELVGDELSVLYFETYAVDLGQIGPPGGTRTPDNRERSTVELLSLDTEDGLSEALVARMRSEAHQRLTGPLAALANAVIAAAWLLAGPFDRRGQALRIGGAVATVVVLQAAGLGALNATAKSSAWAPMMYAVALVPIAVGAFLLISPQAVPWLRARPMTSTPAVSPR